METDFYWEIFRDTGDPVWWLLARLERSARKEDKSRERREKNPAVPG
jgi:hypothetical protein